MITGKKASLAAMLGVGPKEPAPDAETDTGGKVEAAQQMLDAAKANDAGALATAMSAFIDLHMSEEDEEEGEDEADEEPEGADEDK